MKDKIIKDFSEVLGNIDSLIATLKVMNAANGEAIEKKIEETIKQAVDSLLADAFMIVSNQLRGGNSPGLFIRTVTPAETKHEQNVDSLKKAAEPVEYIKVSDKINPSENAEESAQLYTNLAKVQQKFVKEMGSVSKQ